MERRFHIRKLITDVARDFRRGKEQDPRMSALAEAYKTAKIYKKQALKNEDSKGGLYIQLLSGPISDLADSIEAHGLLPLPSGEKRELTDTGKKILVRAMYAGSVNTLRSEEGPLRGGTMVEQRTRVRLSLSTVLTEQVYNGPPPSDEAITTTYASTLRLDSPAVLGDLFPALRIAGETIGQKLVTVLSYRDINLDEIMIPVSESINRLPRDVYDNIHKLPHTPPLL